MSFETRDRYGYEETFDTTDPNEVKSAIMPLFSSLRTEQYDEPDDEHVTVSVTNGDLFIEISVFGRVTLGDLSWVSTGKKNPDPKDAKIMAEDLYMRDVPDDDMLEILTDLALGRFDKVFSRNWVTEKELPPYKRDFYRIEKTAL